MDKKAALFTVFLVVLVDLMGFGIILPLLPFYASKFHATPLVIGLLYSVYSVAQLIFSPFWGSLSDRVGRRPIMLMSTLGASGAYLLFAFSGSLPMLFLSRLLAGIMGGNISAAQAYVADVTTPENRAKGMGLIGAAFGIGFTLGPAIAAILIHPAGSEIFKAGGESLARFVTANPYSAPGFFAAAMSFVSFLLVLFKLPETVRPGNLPDGVRIQRTGVFSVAFWRGLAGEKSSLLLLLLFSVFLLSMGQSSLYGAFPLFCDRILGLSPEKVGLQFMWMGVVSILVQGGLIRILVKRFAERKIFLVGNFLMILGMALIPFAASEPVLTAFLCLMALGGSLNGPTLTSLISKKADPSRVGSAMGTSQGLAALGRVIGPPWGGLLFAMSFRAPFLVTAMLISGTLWAGSRLRK